MPRQFTSDPTEPPVRVIIAGTRTFDDYALLCDRMEYFTYWMPNVHVVSGGQRKRIGYNRYVGADHYGEKWALDNWYTLSVFHPDWDRYGRRAGPIRNRGMAKFATHLVAFWNGVSAGTEDMIRVAEFYGLNTRVVRY